MLNPTVSMTSLRLAAVNSDRLAGSMKRLSSGLRINRASDDAAGLTIAEKFRAQVIGAGQAGRNIQDAINIVSIGEQGVQGLLAPIQRIRELVVEAGNGTNGPAQLKAIQQEIDQLKQLSITAFQLAQQSNMNFATPAGSRVLVFQVGANYGDTITFDYNGLRDSMCKFMFQAFGYQEMYNSPLQGTLAFQLGGFAPPPSAATQAMAPKLLDVTVPNGIRNSLKVIDEALNGGPAIAALGVPATTGLLGALAGLGAVQNRLEHSYAVVMAAQEAQAAAESRIRDADLADEMVGLTRAQLLQRSTLAMVGQANAQASQVLKLVN